MSDDERLQVEPNNATGTDAKPHWQELLEQVWELNARAGDLPLDPPADEVIRQMREERTTRILEAGGFPFAGDCQARAEMENQTLPSALAHESGQ